MVSRDYIFLRVHFYIFFLIIHHINFYDCVGWKDARIECWEPESINLESLMSLRQCFSIMYTEIYELQVIT